MNFKKRGLDVHAIFNRPMPPDAIGQVKRLAADLAEGVLLNYWSNIYRDTRIMRHDALVYGINIDSDEYLKEYFTSIWQHKSDENKIIHTSATLANLIGMGYVKEIGKDKYLPTEKAYALLETSNVEIFISYSIKESSSVAMLVWSELSRMGYNPFIDIRNLSCGDEWHGVLKHKVQSSHVFIVVLDKNTLASRYVRQEIHWANNTQNLKIIPILLAGYSKKDLRKDQNGEFNFLLKKNLIKVKESTSAEFISMVNKLLADINLIR